MSRVRIIRSYPDPEDYLEDWRLDEIKRRAADFAAAIAAYPYAWEWGDGFGGAMMQYVTEALEARGFSTVPPPRGDDGKPKRRPMTNTRRMQVFERDGFTCQQCGAQKDLQVDHIHPVALGGSDDDENLQTLCRGCNASKGAKV